MTEIRSSILLTDEVAPLKISRSTSSEMSQSQPDFKDLLKLLSSRSDTESFYIPPEKLLAQFRRSEKEYRRELLELASSPIVNQIRLLHQDATHTESVDQFVQWGMKAVKVYETYAENYQYLPDASTRQLYLAKRPLVRIAVLSKVYKKLLENHSDQADLALTAIAFRKLVIKSRLHYERSRSATLKNTIIFHKVISPITTKPSRGSFEISEVVETALFNTSFIFANGVSWPAKETKFFFLNQQLEFKSAIDEDDRRSALAICEILPSGVPSLLFPVFTTNDLYVDPNDSDTIVLSTSSGSHFITTCEDINQYNYWRALLVGLFGCTNINPLKTTRSASGSINSHNEPVITPVTQKTIENELPAVIDEIDSSTPDITAEPVPDHKPVQSPVMEHTLYEGLGIIAPKAKVSESQERPYSVPAANISANAEDDESSRKRSHLSLIGTPTIPNLLPESPPAANQAKRSMLLHPIPATKAADVYNDSSLSMVEEPSLHGSVSDRSLDSPKKPTATDRLNYLHKQKALCQETPEQSLISPQPVQDTKPNSSRASVRLSMFPPGFLSRNSTTKTNRLSKANIETTPIRSKTTAGTPTKKNKLSFIGRKSKVLSTIPPMPQHGIPTPENTPEKTDNLIAASLTELEAIKPIPPPKDSAVIRQTIETPIKSKDSLDPKNDTSLSSLLDLENVSDLVVEQGTAVVLTPTTVNAGFGTSMGPSCANGPRRSPSHRLNSHRRHSSVEVEEAEIAHEDFEESLQDMAAARLSAELLFEKPFENISQSDTPNRNVPPILPVDEVSNSPRSLLSCSSAAESSSKPAGDKRMSFAGFQSSKQSATASRPASSFLSGKRTSRILQRFLSKGGSKEKSSDVSNDVEGPLLDDMSTEQPVVAKQSNQRKSLTVDTAKAQLPTPDATPKREKASEISPNKLRVLSESLTATPSASRSDATGTSVTSPQRLATNKGPSSVIFQTMAVVSLWKNNKWEMLIDPTTKAYYTRVEISLEMNGSSVEVWPTPSQEKGTGNEYSLQQLIDGPIQTLKITPNTSARKGTAVDVHIRQKGQPGEDATVMMFRFRTRADADQLFYALAACIRGCLAGTLNSLSSKSSFVSTKSASSLPSSPLSDARSPHSPLKAMAVHSPIEAQSPTPSTVIDWKCMLLVKKQSELGQQNIPASQQWTDAGNVKLSIFRTERPNERRLVMKKYSGEIAVDRLVNESVQAEMNKRTVILDLSRLAVNPSKMEPVYLIQFKEEKEPKLDTIQEL
ncbi:hypothetical protein CANCADRAFT_111464 [Tortispora caseinolytica NRRL Y-17796]|uniref:PH domain-containing protein n=1 Tax=Tortispora caseinolytica NRRL Y-17796 TaxID=767744 RepID=A0A1E4TGD0_9ASCO|nr:hypothetical protein CANCADRAFT_111464 [Tortispora caseinolytica NRRL Y-17796]